MVPASQTDAVAGGAANVPRRAERALVLFPGALGDFLCFLPALLGLRARHSGPLTLVVQPRHFELLRLPDCPGLSMDDRAVADLFSAPPQMTERTLALLGGHTHTYSWTGFGDDNFAARLAQASGGSPRVFPFRGMREGEHAVDYYARCLGVVPSPVPPDVFATDESWYDAFRRDQGLDGRRWLTIHPGSGAPSKNWAGFDALAEEWRRRHGQPVVFVCGPVEEEAGLSPPDTTSVRVSGLTLPRVAALLRHSPLYLGNDSGISHLAGALGTRGVALFADTAPETWAPRSDSMRVVHAPRACSQCGEGVFCEHRLAVQQVLDGLEAGFRRTV